MSYRPSNTARIQPITAPDQKGMANPLDRRGDRRRAHGVLSPLPDRIDPAALRAAMPVLWGRFMQRKFRRIEDVAVHFGVTFQTACNWWHGLHRPQSDAFLVASITWGPEFLEFMQGRV